MATRILICDDDISDMTRLHQYIDRYASHHGLRLEITGCTGTDISAILSKGQKYDILFLNIYLKNMSGIELARRVRMRGSKSEIAFCSNSKEYAFEAFGVNAAQYLVKPVTYKAVGKALNLMMKRRMEDEASINITFNKQVMRIRMADIVYSETIQHYQYITLYNGTVEKTRMSGGKFFEQLKSRHEFVRMGASFIVNLKYVERMTMSSLQLAGGHCLVIPRGAYANLKEEFYTFYAKV